MPGDQVSQPNRWLHLRHQEGFNDEMFAMFQAQCEVWKAYVIVVSAHWAVLQPPASAVSGGRPPSYEFFDAERSTDRTIVTLPVGGHWTLGSRRRFENTASRLLSEFLPLQFRRGLEEGLTETIDSAQGPKTYWRSAAPFEPWRTTPKN